MRVSHGFDAFFGQYLRTALWSSTDESTPEGGEPLDRNYTTADIAPESLELARRDCRDFYDSYAHLWYDDDGDDGDAGHNFWLTRNRHGAGFWDGDYPTNGAELTRLAHAYGECDPIVGDDGLIYLYDG